MEDFKSMRIAFLSERKELAELVEVKLLQDVHILVSYFDSPQSLIAAHLEEEKFDLIIIEMDLRTSALLKFYAAIQYASPIVLIFSDSVSENQAFPELRIVKSLRLQDFLDQFPALVKSVVGTDDSVSEMIRKGYVRVRTEFLSEISPLVSDVFIRFSGGKMIRVFRQGAVFGPEDVDRYVSRKKLDYLYIRKEHSDDLVKRLQSRLGTFIERHVQRGEEATQVFTLAHEMIHELHHQVGFKPETEAMIKDVVHKVLTEFEMHPGLSKAWRSMGGPNTKFISSHSILTGQLACAIASEFDWPSSMTLSKLVYAAFFHDFDLQDDQLAQLEVRHGSIEGASQLNKEIREKFWLHSLHSATDLAKLAGVPQDVDLIIAQHHELPDGSGFPKSLRASQISPLAMVFIVAHEFVTFLIRHNGKLDFDLFQQERPQLLGHPKFKAYVEILPQILKNAHASN